MRDKSQSRLRFSVRALVVFSTLMAISLGGRIAYSKHKIRGLTALRQQGVIVILRDNTPRTLRAIGLNELSPFFDVPTVELYVTPMGHNASIGDMADVITVEAAREAILKQASIARSYGAEDVQLTLIDSFDTDWLTFADENGLVTIEDTSQRYKKRLKANQESGANINP